MGFEIIGDITHIEVIAVGGAIREIARLRKIYGPGRWRKQKGIARIRLSDGTIWKQKCIGTRLMELAKGKKRSSRF